jgi:6-phosphogluconolactonase (cycloisomerase 2 family)
VIAGTFAYTTNTASNTISGYTIDAEGNVNLFDDNGVTADLGDEQSPLDAALSQDDSYLYVLNGRADRIVGFMVNEDGSLVEMEGSHDVPAPSVGLVAR